MKYLKSCVRAECRRHIESIRKEPLLACRVLFYFIVDKVLYDLGVYGESLTHEPEALVCGHVIGIIFLIVPGLLWFYSSSYKRLFMIGNITIALLAGLTPLMVAIANVANLNQHFPGILSATTLEHDIYAWLGGFALFAFLLTWIREIIKDLQDQMGDRELECHSLPVVWGEQWTKVFVTVLLVVTIAVIGHLWYHALPFPAVWSHLSTRYITFGIVIPLLCATWLLWSAKIPSEYKNCQQVIKFTMLLGMLYSFCIVRSL